MDNNFMSFPNRIGTNSSKWRISETNPNMVSASLADMDFEIPEFIRSVFLDYMALDFMGYSYQSEKAFPVDSYTETILHSDQVWQYQHQSYHVFLESKDIRLSMSRKGNSPDNGMMESFFGILKSEMFYGFEKSYKSQNELEQAITDYIFYYNNKRIKTKLKGLSPVQYRTKSFL